MYYPAMLSFGIFQFSNFPIYRYDIRPSRSIHIEHPVIFDLESVFTFNHVIQSLMYALCHFYFSFLFHVWLVHLVLGSQSIFTTGKIKKGKGGKKKRRNFPRAEEDI
jgi:hypothetical protein